MEAAWVLERGVGPAYLSVSCGRMCWTFNNAEALRFARKQDAEAMIQIAPLRDGPEMRACEHAWV